MDFDRRRRIDAQQLKLMEIGLRHPAAIEGDGLIQGLSQSVQRRALHLILCAQGIDDVAADIAGNPDFLDFDHAICSDARLNDFGKITEVTVIKRHPHARPAWQSAPPVPARFFPHQLQYRSHARGIETENDWDRSGPLGIGQDPGRSEQIQTKLQRVLFRRVGELIDERLKYEGERVARRRAHRTCRGGERHE